MKSIIRIAVVFAAMTIGLFSASGAGVPVAKSYDFTGFNKLEFSWVWAVEVVPGSSWSIDVEVTEEAMPYVDVNMIGSTLTLGVRNLPRELSNGRNWNPTAKARITMPELCDVKMSGATKMSVAGSLNVRGEFELDAAGAAVVSKLDLTADKLDLDCSGATKATITAKVRDASLDISGACKINADVTADSAEIEASGAASVKLAGKVNKLDVDCSGACDLNLLQTDVRSAMVELSGAAKCHVNALEKLAVELSGASSCRYADNAGLKVDIISVSRGASLKKL